MDRPGPQQLRLEERMQDVLMGWKFHPRDDPYESDEEYCRRANESLDWYVDLINQLKESNYAKH